MRPSRLWVRIQQPPPSLPPHAPSISPTHCSAPSPLAAVTRGLSPWRVRRDAQELEFRNAVARPLLEAAGVPILSVWAATARLGGTQARGLGTQQQPPVPASSSAPRVSFSLSALHYGGCAFASEAAAVFCIRSTRRGTSRSAERRRAGTGRGSRAATARTTARGRGRSWRG